MVRRRRRRWRGRRRPLEPVPGAFRRLRKAILDVKNFFIKVPRGALLERIKVFISRLKDINPRWRFFSVEKRPRMSVDAEIPRDALRQGGWRRVRPGLRQRMLFTESRRRGWSSLALEDIEDLYRLEAATAMVMVCGRGHLLDDGFGIGATASDGSANLWAADKEDRSLGRQSLVVRQEVKARCCIMRWTDDLVQFWDRDVLPETRRWLWRARQPGFYGPTLDLKHQGEAADTAFGFVFLSHGGTIRARSAPPYLDSVWAPDGSRAAGVAPMVQSGRQFGPRHRAVGAVVGRLLRLLDTSNGSEAEVRASLLRLFAELVLAEYPPACLRSAVRKVQPVAWLDLRDVANMSDASRSACSSYVRTYDGLLRRERALDHALLGLEGGDRA
jgi:hypothetical protein